MTIPEILTALRNRWIIVLSVASAFVAGAIVLTLLQSPLYISSTQLFVSTSSGSSTDALNQGGQFSQQRATSYARLLEGRQVAEMVRKDLGISLSAEALSREITATAVTDTVLINVDVTDSSPSRARAIAAALGKVFSAYAARLEANAAGQAPPVKVTVTETPQLPGSPVSPKPFLNLALGLLAGLVVGGAVAVARFRFDQTVKDLEEGAALVGAPYLGALSKDDRLRATHKPNESMTRVVEDLRQLRANLGYLSVDAPPRVILVTSAMPAEGKTTFIISLALMLAETGNTVFLMEADMRKPRMADYMGLVEAVGLSDVLSGAASLADAAQSYQSGMTVLVAGAAPPDPGGLLGSARMAAIIDGLREANDFVLVDAPPILPVADAVAVSPFVDGVLVLARSGVTKKQELRLASEHLKRSGAHVLAFILNMVPLARRRGRIYGYD